MPRNVVDHIPEPVGREACCHCFQKGCQHEFCRRCCPTATWKNGPKGPERKCGALVGLEETPAFVRGAPAGQKSCGETGFAAFFPEVVVPDVLVELGQIE